MSNEDRSLKIGMKFDDKGAKSAGTSLGDLKKKTDDFNKSVGGLNKTLKSLNVELKLKVKDFSALSKEIEKTGKTFQSQIKDVTAYTKALESLNKALGANTRTAQGRGRGKGGASVIGGVAMPNAASTVGGGGFGAGSAPSNPVFVTMVGGGGVGNQLLPMPGGGFANATGPGRGGRNGGGPGNWINGGNTVNAGNWPGGVGHGQFNLPRYQDMKMTAQMGAGAADFFQSQKLISAQNHAGVKGVRGGMLKNMIGGDFTDVLALTMMNNEGKSSYDKFGGTKLLSTGSFLNGASDVLGGASGNMVGTLAGAGRGGANAWNNSVNGGIENKEANTMLQGIEAVKGMNPIQMQVFQNLMANSSAGLASSRRTGKDAMWSGVGNGMGPSESWAFHTQGSNQFGGDIMMGSQGKGSTRMAPTGRTIQDPKKIAQWESYRPNMSPDAWSSMFAKEVASGKMNTPEMQSQTVAGQHYGGLGAAALGYEKKGFDRNLMMQMMGGVATQQSGDNSTRMEATKKMFAEAMSSGIVKGIKDIQTLEALGTAFAGAIVSKTGGHMTGTGQLTDILTAGMNGANSDPLRVAQRSAGMDAWSDATQTNPFMMNRNMAHANEVLGGKGDIGELMALSKANAKDLLGTGGTLGEYGVTSKQRMDQLIFKMDEPLKMAVSQDSKLRGMLNDKFGGDYSKAIQDPAFQKRASLALANGGPAGFEDKDSNLRALEAFGKIDRSKLADEAGNRDELSKLKDRGGGYLGAAQAQAQTQAQVLTEAFKPENAAIISSTLKAVGSSLDFLLKSSNQTALTDAVTTMKALESLIDKIAKLPVKQIEAVGNGLDRPTKK